MRLGFACAWDAPPEKTWSYTPWHLRAALARRTELIDAGIRLTTLQRKLLDLAHYRFRKGRLTSYYGPSWLRDRVNQRILDRAARTRPFDILLQMDDLAITRTPFFLYQDLCYAILLERLNAGETLTGFAHLTYDMIAWRTERQQKAYERAEGIFTMSQWLANQLGKLAGVPKSKLTVVAAGANMACTVTERAVPPAAQRKKLLFMGRDFYRKGGDLVVQATGILRREYDPGIELTVAGPGQWPMQGDIPPGVRLLGSVAPNEIPLLMATHDLLVIPSRLEPFGIAFVEALSAGLPCIGRNDFAMPELIRNGVNGALLHHDNGYTLAEIILKTLQNDFIYEQTGKAMMQTRQFFNWDRVAGDMFNWMAA